MKTLFTFKHLSCFCVFLFIAIINISAPFSPSAATITSFPPDSFLAVDHTTYSYTYADNQQYNPKRIVGYKFTVETWPNYSGHREYYQLTDTIPLMTGSIWNKNQIDLNQNWQFDFQLFFGKGNTSFLKNNATRPVGKKFVSDGFCFVLHNKDFIQNLIGAIQWEIGYGGITPSFAVEFDTEHNGDDSEGHNYNTHGDNHHIAYLKNGNMTALPGTYRPMQNNWANVGLGDWFDVRIVWRKGYDENNVPYYDLLTYMQEGPYAKEGPLLLRDSMRFNSLNEIIEGLEVDENCQALATWGITSSTCEAANRHAIDFVKLETADVPLASSSLTAVVAANCARNHYFSDSAYIDSNSADTLSIHTKSWYPQYQYRDTILQPFDISDCYGVSNQTLSVDTIEYTISCEDIRKGFYCSYLFELHNMPDSAESKVYIDGTLIDSIIYGNDTSSNPWRFPLERQYFANNSSANIKVVINGIEYNFKIFVEDNTIDWAEQIAQLSNIQLDSDMRSGTLILDTNTFSQSIQLPDFGCSYELYLVSHYDFVTLPTIDSNNILTFELKPNACTPSFTMFLQCECDGMFVLTVKNSDCIENTCELVTIAVPPKKRDTVSGVGKYGSSTNQPVYSPWGYNNSEYTVTSTTKDSNSISYVTVDEIIAQGKTGWIKTKNVTPLNDTSYGVSISFKAPICGETVTKSNYEICAHLMDGTTCCDTFSFNLHCEPPLDWISISSWILPGIISYKLLDEALFNSPIVPPLYVKVFDSFGTQFISTLHSSVPTNLEGLVFYQHLLTGTYNIVFQWGDYIKTLKVMNTGGSR